MGSWRWKTIAGPTDGVQLLSPASATTAPNDVAARSASPATSHSTRRVPVMALDRVAAGPPSKDAIHAMSGGVGGGSSLLPAPSALAAYEVDPTLADLNLDLGQPSSGLPNRSQASAASPSPSPPAARTSAPVRPSRSPTSSRVRGLSRSRSKRRVSRFRSGSSNDASSLAVSSMGGSSSAMPYQDAAGAGHYPAEGRRSGSSHPDHIRSAATMVALRRAGTHVPPAATLVPSVAWRSDSLGSATRAT